MTKEETWTEEGTGNARNILGLLGKLGSAFGILSLINKIMEVTSRRAKPVLLVFERKPQGGQAEMLAFTQRRGVGERRDNPRHFNQQPYDREGIANCWVGPKC